MSILPIVLTMLTGLVALEHLWIMYFEMFLWTAPYGLKFSGMTKDVAQKSKALAANQGLYNGFLAAGLIFSLLHPNFEVANTLRTFFLLCVVVAGFYGGLTANRRIWVVQMVPALLTLALHLFL